MVPREPALPPAPSQQPSHPPRDASAHSKFSRLSSSNEADDERTESDHSFDPLEETPTMRAPHKYGDEDTRPTSRKELAGFYIYGFAAEVFVVCGIGSFIPLTLESLARERGVLLSDMKTPCSPADLPVSPPPPGSGLFPRSNRTTPVEAPQCVVMIGGLPINTASFAMYSFSISVLLQALIIISMSGAADHGRYRKLLLLGFGFTGAISTMLFLPVTPDVFLLGALFAIIGNCCVGASFVLLNSFLPLLVRNHSTIQHPSSDHPGALGNASVATGDESAPPASTEDGPAADSSMDSTSALLSSAGGDDSAVPHPPSPATPSKELQLSTKISSYGMGIGYIAALIVQIVSIFVIVLTGSTVLSLRLVLFMVGAWWFVFTIPAALWLRPRPGPPLSLDRGAGRFQSIIVHVLFSWKTLVRTIARARRLKDVVLFLVAWFLISDAIATVSGTAVLYAKTTLNMPSDAVGLILVVAGIAGILGAFMWSRVSILMGLRPSQTILACIALFELVPIYGLLGLLPFVKNWGFIGLQQPWEMYPVAAIHGFVMGGLSSYCRAVFGELVPPGMETAFFALYAVTDKGSSMFGPAVVGAIVDRTGEIRPAFWFLLFLIGVPFPVIWFIDMDRGRREGNAMAREMRTAATHAHGVEDEEESTRLMS